VIDQTAANALIERLARWRPLGAVVRYQGAEWTVAGHREIGQFGPWGSLGAIPKLTLRSRRDDSLRVDLAADEAEALMRDQP
jgi:hypothetical protein